MCHNPSKYASEETEQYIKISDYKNIENYFKKFYPALFLIDNFEMRHLIYDLKVNLSLLAKFSHDKKLKNIVVQLMNEINKMLHN